MFHGFLVVVHCFSCFYCSLFRGSCFLSKKELVWSFLICLFKVTSKEIQAQNSSSGAHVLKRASGLTSLSTHKVQQSLINPDVI